MGYFDTTRKALLDDYLTSPVAGASKEWNEVDARVNPGDNTFDQSYLKGRFPMWVRKQGEQPGIEPDDSATMRDIRGETDVPPLYANRRPAAEEAYVNALAEFFGDRLALWPGTASQKDYVRQVMYDGRSQQTIADEEGVSQAAVSQGRARAVEAFVKAQGGKEALAEALRTFLHARESHDGKDRLKYLPRWVH